MEVFFIWSFDQNTYVQNKQFYTTFKFSDVRDFYAPGLYAPKLLGT